MQKFLATETAANAATKSSACNGNDSAMVTGMAETVSSESYCPSNVKDDSDSESSFDSSQYNEFGPPSDDDEEGYLCFGSPPSLEDMDVFVTKFAPLSEGASSTLASVTDVNNAKNLCVNQTTEDPFKCFQPSSVKDFGEIMSRSWSTEMQDNMQDFDPNLDFFIEVLLYGDKMGTDINQHYPLEPWMFTLTMLCRAAREKATSWRHLGFLPLQDYFPFQQLDNKEEGSLSSKEKLQQYHDYMAALLHDLKVAYERKPIMWLNLGGV